MTIKAWPAATTTALASAERIDRELVQLITWLNRFCPGDSDETERRNQLLKQSFDLLNQVKRINHASK